jgi:hypothetical protein
MNQRAKYVTYTLDNQDQILVWSRGAFYRHRYALGTTGAL